MTEKNGTRKFFGGEPNNGSEPAAILTDGAGHVAYWALTEARDANDNFVKYRYIKVTDAGTPLDMLNQTPPSNPGYNLYLASDSYPGQGNNDAQ